MENSTQNEVTLKIQFHCFKDQLLWDTLNMGGKSDHETKLTPFFVTNTLFLENMHFKAPWGSWNYERGIQRFESSAGLRWGKECGVWNTQVNYSMSELWEIKDHTLERPFPGSGFTEYYSLWSLNLNFILFL